MKTAPAEPVPDVSPAYHRWDELVSLGLRMALAESEEPLETRRLRLARSQQRSLEERDRIWVRILDVLRGAARGR